MANEKLDQFEEEVKKLEHQLNADENKWNKEILDYTNQLKGDVKELHVTDANITNSRQLVSSEIRKHALSIHKTNKNVKQMVKKQFEHYSTNYQIVLKSSSDKMKLIESDIRSIQYKIDLLNSHISFLRETNDNLKQMGYSVKNRIELLNILGLD